MRRLIPSPLALQLAGLLMAGSLLASGNASAACQIDTRPVAFGVVDVTRQNDSNGEIALNCSIATEVEVALSSSTTPGQRFMAGPSGGRLTYELYPDAARSVPWGDGTGNSTTQPVISDGESTTRLTIYGRVPRQDAVPPGAYGDALTVQVTF
jgi:spore coat protein U-like protein